jgi:hypothetical protein
LALGGVASINKWKKKKEHIMLDYPYSNEVCKEMEMMIRIRNLWDGGTLEKIF